MHPKMQLLPFSDSFLNESYPLLISSLAIITMSAKRKRSIDKRLIPCMYLTQVVLGASSSFFLK
jgi:hypothetical protein